MDRTDRPVDDRDAPGESAGDDATGGDESTDATGGDDRSALHVASEGANWRFSLEDLDDDEPAEQLTPGSPAPEHVAFVLLGAAFTLFVFSRFLV